ncbi:MAG: HD domain-containing phosphohydrolase, partial [Campylobacterota bacterium]
LIFVLLGYVWRLNTRLHRSKKELQEINKDLEIKITKRTDSIENMLEKEKYLRLIMSTVSDINRYLITYKDLGTLLQKSCERLIKPKMYKLGFITLEGKVSPQTWFGASKDEYQKLETFLQEEFAQSRGIARHFEEKKSYEIINDVRTYDLDEQFRALCLDAGIKACAFFALKPDVDLATYNGVVGILSDSEKGFELEEITMLEELSGDLGFAIEASLHASEHERLKNEQIKNYEETILSFVKMIEQRDTYTAGHTTRVARYCTMIAHQMGLDEKQVQKLEKAAILHDIGKISTPDAVLLKPGKLNDLEYKMIKEHVSVGYDMLKQIGAYSDLAKIMRHHHERHDGSGYPDGLAGDEIPLLSAIMSVADAFDAMTSTRIYKKSKSVSQALQEIEQLSGKQFHPKTANAAVKALEGVTPPPAAQQTPTNEIERERLAYFYKDAQTGLYNESYLTVMLTQNESLLEQSHIYAVHAQNAVQMQLKEGVKTIEHYLAEVAKLLQKRYELVFFVKPGSFYIITQNDYGQALGEFVDSLEFDGLEFVLSRVQKEELKKSFLS